MRIDIVTLFPEMFKGPFEKSIVKRAQEKGLVEIKIHNLRQWAEDKHKTVDDRPYGGGVGMVLMVEPIYSALKVLKSKMNPPAGGKKQKIILLDPGGSVFSQTKAQELSKLDHLILVAAHYEGVDHRVREHLVDEELSIGNYILTGGELPVMVLVDAIIRLIPGVLEKPEATQFESFSNLTPGTRHPACAGRPTPALEHPQYTRPENFKGWRVPEVLLSGNHREIENWREEQAIKRTKEKRLDLFKK